MHQKLIGRTQCTRPKSTRRRAMAVGSFTECLGWMPAVCCQNSTQTEETGGHGNTFLSACSNSCLYSTGYPIEPRPGASLWSFMCLRDYSGGLDRRANGPSAVGTLLPLLLCLVISYIPKTAPARGHMNYLQIPSTPVTGDWLWGPPSRRDTSYLALALLHGPLRSNQKNQN